MCWCVDRWVGYELLLFPYTGYVREGLESSHYMRQPDISGMPPLRNPKAKALLHHISTRYDTLAFCRKWLDQGGETKHLMALKNLVSVGCACMRACVHECLCVCVCVCVCVCEASEPQKQSRVAYPCGPSALSRSPKGLRGS